VNESQHKSSNDQSPGSQTEKPKQHKEGDRVPIRKKKKEREMNRRHEKEGTGR
jgi:hypothetical protein